jgi:23S rRNA pseudouridine1911/1915/1917 synthase
MVPLQSEYAPAPLDGHPRGPFLSSDDLSRHLAPLSPNDRVSICDEIRMCLLTSEPCKKTLDAGVLGGTVPICFSDDPVIVRGSVEICKQELQRRSQRLLGLLCGRSVGEGGMQRIEQRVEALLTTTATQHDAYDQAVYHGIITYLCDKDPALAEEMAANELLPLLNATVATALARLPKTEDSVSALELAAARHLVKDGLVSSTNTVATALAVRARKIHWDVNQPMKLRNAAYHCMKTLAKEYRVDPSVVFASNAMAIQEWAVSQWPKSMAYGSAALAESNIVLDKLLALHASLRGTTANAVSSICMSDIERPWIEGVVAAKDDGTGNWRSNLPIILHDAKRWLVDSRLLREYAELLEDGHLSCRDASFAPFLDECGECYLGERPSSIRFTFRDAKADEGDSLPSGVARDALIALAPASSFWVTLLKHTFHDAVRTSRTSDGGAWWVSVTFPQIHEAVRNTKDIKEPTVLFEDEDVVAFCKPPKLPVSRHALCCTQRGGEIMTDLSAILFHSPRAGFKEGSGVFRGGQLHRLDQDTSGVIVYAKTEQSMRILRHQMGSSAEYGAFPKCYMALCRVLGDDLSSIRMAGVIKDMHDPRITTRYSINKFFPRFRIALIECRIQQGKKHQIRRHLASMGMPILQDVEYGGAACTTPLIDRVALHASGITFVHPKRQRPMHLSAALPEDMRSALRVLQQSSHNAVTQ